jgi:hypothetical protein
MKVDSGCIIVSNCSVYLLCFSLYGRELLNHRRNALKVSEELPSYIVSNCFALLADGSIQYWCSRLKDYSNLRACALLFRFHQPRNYRRTTVPKSLHRKNEGFIILPFLRHYIVVSPAGISTRLVQKYERNHQVWKIKLRLQHVIQARKQVHEYSFYCKYNNSTKGEYWFIFYGKGNCC